MNIPYPDDTITEKILENSLEDTQKLSQDPNLSAIERKLVEVQYYQLLFIISFIHKERVKQENWKKWWDKLQWVIIPMVISGFFIFIWQALYFYFNLVPYLEQIAHKP